MQCGDCDTAVPGEAQSETDEACEEICSHCEKCEEDEEDELPLPSCYMPRGDDGPDYDPDKHVWEFRVSAYLVGNYSLASTYPQSLFLGVMPVDDHGPYRIILLTRDSCVYHGWKSLLHHTSHNVVLPHIPQEARCIRSPHQRYI